MNRLLIIAAAIVVTSCGFFPDEAEPEAFELPEPPQISRAATYPVEREEIMEVIEGTVRVTPIREVSLYFKVSGRIHLIDIQPEQQVSEGELLGQLEIDDLAHSLALSRIDLRIAEALYSRMQASDAATIDLEIESLRLQKQRLAVSYLEKKVSAATIVSPFDGVIKRVQVKVSDLVREYDPVVVISDPTELEMQMSVNQDEYYEIDNTMAAEIQEARDEWIPVEIIQTTHLNPRVDASVSREEYIVHLAFKDPAKELRLNERKTGRIIIKRHESALVIPSAALREFGDRTYVRVLDDGVRREVDVRTGIHTGTRVEIVDGLEEGELVIGK